MGGKPCGPGPRISALGKKRGNPLGSLHERKDPGSHLPAMMTGSYGLAGISTFPIIQHPGGGGREQGEYSTRWRATREAQLRPGRQEQELPGNRSPIKDLRGGLGPSPYKSSGLLSSGASAQCLLPSRPIHHHHPQQPPYRVRELLGAH